MAAPVTTGDVHTFVPRRMTPEQYRAERERIEQTYGSSSAVRPCLLQGSRRHR